MTATVNDVLIVAKGLLTGPEKWTKKTYAEDAKGRAIHLCNPSSRIARFSIYGALGRAVYLVDRQAIEYPLDFHLHFLRHPLVSAAIYALDNSRRNQYGPIGHEQFMRQAEYKDIIKVLEGAVEITKDYDDELTRREELIHG